MAREFDDGSSQYLQGSFSGISDAPFTISAWMYPHDFGATQAFVSVTDVSASNVYIVMYAMTTKKLLCQYRTPTFHNAEGGTLFTQDQWDHAAYVVASNVSRIAYVNASAGVEDTADDTIAGLDTIGIGRLSSSSPSSYLDGAVCEVAIWNAALTAIEIAILDDGFSALFVRPQNLVFYAPLFRDEDTDRVGGLALADVGGPTIATHPPIIYPAPSVPSYAAATAPPAGITVPVAWHHLNKNIGR